MQWRQPSINTTSVSPKAFADKLPLMAGSSDRLQQLFLNLINNSLDAMPEGGEIQIHTASEGKPGKAQRITWTSSIPDPE